MRKLTTREQLTIDYLPECKWVIKTAGIKAGFSEKYAQHMLPQRVLSNIALKAAFAAKVAEIGEKIEITRQECIDNARWLVKYGRDNNRSTAFAQGNDQLCKIAGIFTENLNTTDTQRQRELDEKEQAEAAAIATIRLRELKAG